MSVWGTSYLGEVTFWRPHPYIPSPIHFPLFAVQPILAAKLNGRNTTLLQQPSRRASPGVDPVGRLRPAGPDHLRGDGAARRLLPSRRLAAFHRGRPGGD